jgi:hypothetical protein
VRTLISVAAVLLASSIAVEGADEGWKLIGQQGMVHFVVIDKNQINDRQVYHLASAEVCSDRPICQVIFWAADSDAPKSLPMTDQQVSAQVAVWNSNSNIQLKQMLWSCKMFPDTPKTECF